MEEKRMSDGDVRVFATHGATEALRVLAKEVMERRNMEKEIGLWRVSITGTDFYVVGTEDDAHDRAVEKVTESMSVFPASGRDLNDPQVFHVL